MCRGRVGEGVVRERKGREMLGARVAGWKWQLAKAGRREVRFPTRP